MGVPWNGESTMFFVWINLTTADLPVTGVSRTGGPWVIKFLRRFS